MLVIFYCLPQSHASVVFLLLYQYNSLWTTESRTFLHQGYMNFFLLCFNNSFYDNAIFKFHSYSDHRFPVQFSPQLARVSKCLIFLWLFIFKNIMCPIISSNHFSLSVMCTMTAQNPCLPGDTCQPLTSCYDPDQTLSRLHGYHWSLSLFPVFHDFLSLISPYFCWCKSSNNFLRMVVHARQIFLLFAYPETLLFATVKSQ